MIVILLLSNHRYGLFIKKKKKKKINYTSAQVKRTEDGVTMSRGHLLRYTQARQIACKVFPKPMSSAISTLPFKLAPKL